MQPASEVYSREEYATKDFWENRYKEKGGYFDWYAEFPELQDTFENQYSMQKQNSILMLGCGNSKLSEQMYDAGYHEILNIDISESVIEQMRAISIEKGQTEMKWQVMDATNMNTIKDQSFDCVIDKGTLDALISGKDLTICEKMIRETMRILKEDGQFILITYGSPEGRKKLFQNSIGLENYDYYVTRVDLSTMSTLINLMRSNLDGKPLNNIMKDKGAMAKSMLEFNLVQMLRKKRKNEKKFIIWKNYEKKNVVFNEQTEEEQKPILNQPQKEKDPSQHKQQVPAKEKQTKQQAKQQVKQQKKEQGKQEIKEEKIANKPTYNPKKQCYCYVYSIKHKFGVDFEKVVQTVMNKGSEQILSQFSQISDQVIAVKGEESLNRIDLYVKNDKKIQKFLAHAIFYIKKKGLTMNPLNIYRQKQNFIKLDSSNKLVIVEGSKNKIPLFHKTVLEVKIERNQVEKLSEYENKLNNIKEKILQDLNCHPTPRQYAFMGVALSKVNQRTQFHQFLKKYWYPQWKFYPCENCLCFKISVPPTACAEKVSTIIKQILGKQCQISIAKRGLLNIVNPRIMAIFNMSSILFNNGDDITYEVSDFTEEEEIKEETYPLLMLEDKNMERIMAHFLCSF